MLQNNTPESLPTSKPKHKMILPLALVLTFLAFGSLAFAWYQTYYTLPSVLPSPVYTAHISTDKPVVPDIPNPSEELIDINDYTAIDPVTGWTIYTNETVGYQISYPQDWLVDRELGTQGYYYGSVRITFKKEPNAVRDYYSLYVYKVNLIGAEPKNSTYSVLKKLELEVGEQAVFNFEEGEDPLVVGHNEIIVRLSNDGFGPEDSIVYFLTPTEGAPVDFYTSTIIYNELDADNVFAMNLTVPPPSSEYFDARFFNNLEDDGMRYNEALQILNTFKPL